MLIAVGLSFAAGLLAALSPCVFPLLPLVVGTAARGHRTGPLALAAGLVAMFTTLGVLLASVRGHLPIDDAFACLGDAARSGRPAHDERAAA